MASSSSFSSSDDDSRNEKGSRKRRKAHGGDKRRGSQRENDNHRKSTSEKNERRNQFHRDNRTQRKRRLENTPPRREDPPVRHREEESATRRPREESNQARQRDGRDRRQNKSSFEQAKVKKEPSPDWGRPSVKKEEKPNPQEKEKPNFGLSGKLTEDTNTVNGVVVKYSEPEDARKPKRRWRLYQFKGEKNLPTLHISRQSGYLIGRDRKVADLPIDHPSCSKQHAAFQFRLVPYTRENGTRGQRVRPYLIDLDSANGTFVNGVKLEPRRYHELLERDVIKFGFSSREYVLLHEQSKDEDLDDDVPTA